MMVSITTPLSCTTTKIEEERMSEVPPPTLDREKRLYASLSKTTSTIAKFLIPSFLQRNNQSKTKIMETSYLNGIRGLASFLVYFQHIATEYGDWIHQGYHSRPEDN
jgi:hypothetical protein